MVGRVLRAILILPGAVLFVPAIIVTVSGILGAEEGWNRFGAPAAWLAVLFALGGLAMAAWTVRLLVAEAASPSALMDPKGRLVIRGPYRHCRNPMICASLLMIAAEALWLDLWPLGVWLALFYAVNAIYIPRVEERGLEARFGAAYRRYKAHVPRWFPTPLAYDPSVEPEADRNAER